MNENVMTQKICVKCKSPKPVSEFSKNNSRSDGLRLECKACQAAYDRVWHRENRERLAVISRTWAELNKDKINTATRKWKVNNQDKIRVQNKVRNAVRRGEITHASHWICFDCDCVAQHYHHEDYGKPFYVVALCRRCHKARHAIDDK
jgi:hypothetical protein